jgi:O-antigen/teichoic acid export membrane protein
VDYRSAVRFGVPTAAGAVGAMLLYRLDVLLVSLWSGVDSAGLYVVALAYTEIVWIVPTAAAQALVPHAAQADSRIDTGRLCRSVVVLMVVVAAVLSLAGPAVVPWVFGADFQEAVVAVLPLSLAAIAVGVWKLVGHDLIARGDSHSRLWSGVLGIATMVALDAVLVPRFGVRGAAFGSLGAYAVASAVVVARWCRRFGVGPATLLVPRREDLTYILRRSRGVFSTTGRHERPAETRGGTEGE